MMIRKAMLFHCLRGLPAMIANVAEMEAWSKMRVMAVPLDIDLSS
jgi:hypothetical protein